MNPAQGLTTALGVPLPKGFPSEVEYLAAHGLHPSDSRMKFAATALRASRPQTWPRLLKRFGHEPAAVSLPAPERPLDRGSFASAQRSFIDAMASSTAARRVATPKHGWSLLSCALLLWLSRGPALKADDLLTLTFVLQSLADTHIERVDAALFFALTAHAEWRAAALEFLTPYRDTFAADWLAARPEYRKLAASARAEYQDVPAWLCLNRT